MEAIVSSPMGPGEQVLRDTEQQPLRGLQRKPRVCETQRGRFRKQTQNSRGLADEGCEGTMEDLGVGGRWEMGCG